MGTGNRAFCLCEGYTAWTCFPMMTSSNGSIFRVTGPLCGEFTGPGEFPTQRPVTQSFDGFFYLRLNKRLSKQPWGWWFETLSWSLWRHCNAHYWPIVRETRRSRVDYRHEGPVIWSFGVSLLVARANCRTNSLKVPVIWDAMTSSCDVNVMKVAA